MNFLIGTLFPLFLDSKSFLVFVSFFFFSSNNETRLTETARICLHSAPSWKTFPAQVHGANRGFVVQDTEQLRAQKTPCINQTDVRTPEPARATSSGPGGWSPQQGRLRGRGVIKQ